MRDYAAAWILAITFPVASGAQPPPGGPHPPPEVLIRDFDRDRDGRINRAEAPEPMLRRWRDIDTDGDGFVTLAELKARDAHMGPPMDRPDIGPASRPDAGQRVVPIAKPGTRAFVNAAQTAQPQDGRSWRTAYASLQAALASGAAEIWVARGTYTPGTGRDATFQLRQGGSLYGGFAGTEGRREQRDWVANPTVLDGKRAYHVVTGADDAVLDGFTITGGDATGARNGAGGPGGGGIHMTPQSILGSPGADTGGGLLNFKASPTVRHCVFDRNRAGKGGAVYNMTGAAFPPRPGAHGKAPLFVDCTFRGNSAFGRGGGVSNDLATSPTFLNCVFEANETPQKGGGMYNDFGCSPILLNCLFTGNRADSAGGMGNDGGSSPVLDHCTFTKNHATDYGAPLYQGTGPANDPTLIGCVIEGNTCDWEDPGIYNWHDDTPRIVPDPDPGYRPGRYDEAGLRRLADLERYRANPAREPAERGPATPSPSASQRVVYVDAAAASGGDGRSWATAFDSLPAALADAGHDGAEVRVAGGTYRLGGDRSASFLLRPGVRVRGGYHGAECDPTRYPTVLDGNHAYHVVVGADGTTLDGLTITGGLADGPGYDGKGGGLVTYRNAPQARPKAPVATGFSMNVSRCLFTGNVARDGGAVYSYDRAKVVFHDCRFVGNRADNGGAVLDRVGVVSAFESCEFRDNTARWRGGAAYFDYGSRPKLTGCVFRGNTTGGHGGAVFSVSRASQLENTVVTLERCRFDANSARGRGGAAAFCDSSVRVVEGCTFAGNSAGLEGADLYTDPSSTGKASGKRPRRTP